MRHILGRFVGVLGILCLTATLAHADAKAELQSTGPDDSIGASVSQHGNHVAVLAPKGSRFEIIIDGVAGPKIDALLNNITGGPVGGTYWIGKIPVAWSPQGDHSAYVAKMGDEAVVYYDNKELTRGPIRNAGQINMGLSFSNNGKHFYYMDSDDDGKYRIVVDGKPGPGSQQPPALFLSPDGDHYAYIGYEHNGGGPPWGIVDGQKVNYFGEQLQYTAKNHLISILPVDKASELLIDGKPMIKAMQVTPLWVSPDGAQLGNDITPNQQDSRVLLVNGKPVPGTEGITVQSMYFSPDAKRWAALCQTKTGSKFMIVDGKKGDEYQEIDQSITSFMLAHWYFQTANMDIANGLNRPALLALQPAIPGFTGDSSKFVYKASQGGRSFIVVDDQESDGYSQMFEIFLATSGSRYGFIAQANNGKQHVVIDGKDQQLPSLNVPTAMRPSGLSFSPGGTHYAYIFGNTLCLDGVAQPGMCGSSYVFSPDDKHIAYEANVAGKGSFIVDGKVIATDIFQVTWAFFSPDSKHVVCIKNGNLASQGTKDNKLLYVDGKMVTHFIDTNSQSSNFEFSADGTVMTFLARTDDTFKKFVITMPTESLDTLLATAPVAKDK